MLYLYICHFQNKELNGIEAWPSLGTAQGPDVSIDVVNFIIFTKL